MAADNMVELDGRTLEGGGQLIRIALCLSALTGVSVKIDHIRGNRSGGGGLKAQHLACVNWLAYACKAYVEGAEKGSKTLLFRPGKPEGDLSPAFRKRQLSNGHQVYDCHLDIGTAGSTGLALQAILPYILFTKFPSSLPVHLRVSGGTNVSGSPSYEYLTQVLLPTLKRIGCPEITATIGKRGWSHGGSSIGNFTLVISPRPQTALAAFRHRPEVTPNAGRPAKPSRIKAIFIAPSTCLGHFRKILAPAINHHFGDFSHEDGNLEIICEGSLHEKRMYFILVATFPGYILGRDWLYDRKIRSHERAATEMAERVTNDLAGEWLSGGWVDEHMRDQLVIFQALAQGRSEVYPGREEGELDEENDEEGAGGSLREPSLHARTAEWVARQLLGVRFDSEGICDGVAFGAVVDESLIEEVGNLDLLE